MTNPADLKQCTVSDAVAYTASKWLHHQALVDGAEMRALAQALGDFQIFHIGTVLPANQGKMEKEDFFKVYDEYVAALQAGKQPQEASFRIAFSSVFTRTSDSLFSLTVDGGQHIVRIRRPVLQIQAHSMDFSTADRSFRPMVYGRNTITWGLQFSYPQLFLNPETQEIEKVTESESFPNTLLFKTLARWLRSNTVPVRFLVENDPINTALRLGKNCLEWINVHPQLVQKKIRVANTDKGAS